MHLHLPSGTVVTGTSAAMANAAFLALATQASISLVNNKGNLGKTFKELGRSSTVKNLATAVLTAGVADKIGATTALNNVSNTEWVNNLSVNLANAGSSAVIGTAINGGSLQDSLESAILSALVQTAHGAAASKIKDLDNHYIAHKVAHAVAGCAAAAANKGKCQDGAIGAAVGEIVGEKLLGGRDLSKLPAAERAAEEAKIIAYSRLVAGTAAGLTGGDVNVAADAAKVAVENNALRWTSTTSAEVKQDNEEKKARNDWFSILLPAHAVTLSKDSKATGINSFRDGLRTISLTGAAVSGYSPVVIAGGKVYFISATTSAAQGAAFSTIAEGQPYRMSDLAYDATLGVLMNKGTGKMITWADTDSKIIKTYLYSKGEVTNNLLGKGGSGIINHVLQDKNTILIEVPEWRKHK